MQTIAEIRSLLAARGLHPKHRYGQNFLHDQNQIRRLLAAADLAPGDLVLEVGPGTGTLTEALLDADAEVITCEIDDDMASIIEDRIGDRVTLVRGDCLGRGRALSPDLVDLLGGRPFRLIANLPYQAASPLMMTLLLGGYGCLGQYVTIQREVADRLAAPPGTKAYGPLTILAQVFGTVRRIGTISPQCFWPAPKVTSAMVAIEPRADRGIAEPERFARFVNELFQKRRKQLGTAFGRDIDWPDGVTPDLRPEALTTDQIVELSRRVLGGD